MWKDKPVEINYENENKELKFNIELLQKQLASRDEVINQLTSKIEQIKNICE